MRTQVGSFVLLCCQLCIHTLIKLCWKKSQGPKKRLPQWFYCRKMYRKKRRLQHRLFITAFLTFKSFGSGCWVCCCMSACCLCRCPQRTKVVLAVMWYLSWMRPPRYHNAVVLLCNKDKSYDYVSATEKRSGNNYRLREYFSSYLEVTVW